MTAFREDRVNWSAVKDLHVERFRHGYDCSKQDSQLNVPIKRHEDTVGDKIEICCRRIKYVIRVSEVILEAERSH